MKYDPLSRRMFLQGMGGALVAAPFLASLAPREAWAQSAAAPKRFAMMLGHYGRDISQWYPNLPESTYSKVPGAMIKALGEIPKPLSYCIGNEFNPVINKISLVRGLDTMSTQGNHNNSLPTTGSSIDPRNISGFGYSIDAVLEESTKFYPTLPVLGALRTSPNILQPFSEFSSFSFTSKTTRGQMLNVEWNPQQVFNQLLNPAGVQTMNAQRGRIRSVTDLVLGNFKQTMSGRSISSEDKMRLDNYMSQISDVHVQLGVVAKACAQANDPGKILNAGPAILTEVHKAMIRMEVAALTCGVTRIVMHSMIHGGDIENPTGSYIVDPQWHPHAHGGEYSVNPATGKSYLSEHCKWNMQMVAYFLNQMDQVPDSSGTLLDNTLFMYGNEDGTGSHEHLDLPVLVAGGQGKLKTGYLIDYRPRPFVNLIRRAQQINGISPEVNAGRPYNSMLVTAFKALGLTEADYQKFGQQGFGRYESPFLTAPKDYYQQYLGAQTNTPLPFLYAG